MSRDSTPQREFLRVGVSACLLGQKVRYDRGHKRNSFLMDEMDPFVEWVSVCPEVEAGLGVPRPAMHLSRKAGGLKLIESQSGLDRTRTLEVYSRRRVLDLRRLGLSGYILKKDSPSCGMSRVKVRDVNGMPERNGRGLFAEALMKALPSLPIEEEGRLNDSRLRENFVERIFAYARLSDLFHGRWTIGEVMGFHASHKLQLLAHSTVAYQELGKRVARAKDTPRAEFREGYSRDFMDALGKMATPGRNANVLQHAAGYFKKRLPSTQRTELADLIHDHRRGWVPLVVPLTLIRHYASLYEVEYLKGQFYLEPHPRELMLRNHV